MSAEEIINHMDAHMARLERLTKLLLAIMLMVIAGAVWAARMEWRVGEAADAVKELGPLVRSHETSIAVLRNQLGGFER